MAIRGFIRLASVAALLLSLLAVTAPARAGRSQTIGGDGGNPFEFRCPAGSYLVGVRSRAGYVVDHIGAVCGAWDPVTRVAGAGRDMRTEFGGTGGQWTRFGCPPGAALSGWRAGNSYADDPTVLGFLEAPKCRSLADPAQAVPTQDRLIGRHQARSGFPAHFVIVGDYVCPPGEVGVGIFGGAGQFVDRIGLVCDVPAKAAAPAPPAQTIATARNDVDIYDQPDGDVGKVIGVMRQGERHPVVTPSSGWSELADVPAPGRRGWVANDHLTFSR